MSTLLRVILPAAVLFASLSSSAQTPLRQNNCDRLNAREVDALNKHQWQVLIDVSREQLTYCNFGSARNHASTLGSLGIGMIELRQYGDAVPVLRKCVAVDPDYAGCWAELGDAYLNMGMLTEAEEALRSAVDVGGYDEVNAAAIAMAKEELAYVEVVRKKEAEKPIVANAPPATPTHTYGTGFFVTGDGHILTNNHVVSNCRTITTRNGTPLQLVSRSARADLALLKAPNVPSMYATFRSGPSPRTGDSVVAFGFPLIDTLSSEGNVSAGLVSATAGLHDDVRYIQMSAPVQPGNSGGPLLDASGHVIGVVVAKLDAIKVAQLIGDMPQNVNFAVHWTEIRAFLDEEGIQYRKSPSERPLKTADIAAVAAQMSVSVDCAE